MLRVKTMGFLMFFPFFFRGCPMSAKDRFWEGLGGPLRALWGVLFGILEGLWLFLGIVWVQNGARNVKMRVYLAQVKVTRGSQRLSGFDFETIFITSCVLFGISVCFLVRKGFVHAVWYLAP